jgi:SAM-dependent methyltransferase
MQLIDPSQKEFFDSIAAGRARYRKKRRYYWDYITRYCNYFMQCDNSVLEIGCGLGNLLADVKGSRKVGIDFSEAMIAEARRLHEGENIEFRVMDAHDMALEEKFDVIILSNLIGSLQDVQTCFEQLHKAAHPQTRILITYSSYLWEPVISFAEWIGIKKKMPRQNWLSTADVTNMLYLAGFEVYRKSRNMLIPFSIPVFSWCFNKFLSRLPGFTWLGLNRYIFARPQPELQEPKTYSTSVVIPARNESGNIEDAITRLPEFGKHVEIIFIEGNSTDDTWAKIQEMQQKYASTHDIKIGRQTGKGKGDAVRMGYSMATGDILMILDADLTVPPEELPKFYDAIASGKGEFINGCRLIYPMEKGAMRFLNVLGNKFFSSVFTWLLEQPIKDTLCGTKVLFRKDYLKLEKNRLFFGDFDPFGDFDLILGSYKLNLKIIDLPIRYKERKYGDTNISRFKHGFVLLKMSIFASRKLKFF